MCSITVEKYSNKQWEENTSPTVTLITPVYNRRSVLKRTLNSVKQQTYKNFEYIIVNDGSKEEIDDIIYEFMNSVSFPVLYVKKENGGVHTARNIGTKLARGEYWINIDSDDELLLGAIETLLGIWENLQNEEKDSFFEVRACCMDHNNQRVGEAFPERGSMTLEKWISKCRELKFDNVAMRRTYIMKENEFPEPKGIKFIPESLLWIKLQKKYKSYYVNDILLRVHTEEIIDGVDDHLSRNKRNTIDSIKGECWRASYIINNWECYKQTYGIRGYLINIAKFCVFANVLVRKKVEWKEFIFDKNFPKMVMCFFWIPAKVIAHRYKIQ